MSSLEGKNVLISGVGRGLGREVAEVALREGARVALGARSTDVVADIATELDGTGERAVALRLDVSKPDACAQFAAEAAGRLGKVDALINLAALDAVIGGLDGADWDSWHQMFEVNVFGAMYLVDAAIPHFAQLGGAIVFVGSQTMYLPPPRLPQAGYAASKAAVIGAMRHLTIELGRRGIRINSVAPGWMWGPAVEGYVQYRAQKTGVTEEEAKAEITDQLPLKEMASDTDVAEAIVFLASDRARGITGQSLLVNAGEYMQ